MKLEKKLNRYGGLIEKELREYFQKLEREASDYHQLIEECYSDLKEFVMREGKRIASCSTLLTYEGYGGDIDENILDVCVGIELYRHSILLHDDLIDEDNLRRGGRTFHKIYSQKWNSRFGRGSAMFTGNIAFILATRAIRESGFSKKKVGDVLSTLLNCYREVNESQILDLIFEYRDVDVEEWQIMASRRAASLFRFTILTGAILSGIPKEELGILRKAATNIGFSFDIQDDIIDTFAKEEEYGRPPCRDVKHGKKPLHIIQSLKLGNSKESRKLRNLLDKKSIESEEINLIRTLIRTSGGLEAAKNASKDYAKRAKKLLHQTNLNDEAKETFDSLIPYVVESLDWYE